MNHQFYPYQQQVIPFFPRGKGDISVFGGTHPYGQGGNGLGGMFRSLFRTATPFLKTAAKKVGKRLLSTGVDTGVQIAKDVINGQSLKKAAKARAKTAGKQFLTGAFRTLRNKVVGEDYLSANEKRLLPVQDRLRNGEHHLQSSKPFSTKDGLSSPSLCPR